MKADLDELRVVQHCPMSWHSMSGDDRVRHCDRCEHFVYNIENMTRQEAEDLIREYEGPLCVRYYKRSDGTIVTRDCGGFKWAQFKFAAGVASVLAAVGFVAAPNLAQGKVASPRVTALSMVRQNEELIEKLKTEKDPAIRADLEWRREDLRRRFAENLDEIK